MFIYDRRTGHRAALLAQPRHDAQDRLKVRAISSLAQSWLPDALTGPTNLRLVGDRFV